MNHTLIVVRASTSLSTNNGAVNGFQLVKRHRRTQSNGLIPPDIPIRPQLDRS